MRLEIWQSVKIAQRARNQGAHIARAVPQTVLCEYRALLVPGKTIVISKLCLKVRGSQGGSGSQTQRLRDDKYCCKKDVMRFIVLHFCALNSDKYYCKKDVMRFIVLHFVL